MPLKYKVLALLFRLMFWLHRYHSEVMPT